jgi:heat shock protein HslJ
MMQIAFAQKPAVKAGVPKQSIKDKTTYYLTVIYSGGKKNMMVKDKGHIVFDLKAKTASCFTSCNFIKLNFTMKDQAIKFTNIVPAKEPCPDPLIGIEEDLKTNLPKINAYSVMGKQITFMKDKETLIIFTEATEPAVKK